LVFKGSVQYSRTIFTQSLVFGQGIWAVLTRISKSRARRPVSSCVSDSIISRFCT